MAKIVLEGKFPDKIPPTKTQFSPYKSESHLKFQKQFTNSL
jgi:hypothetical protein